MKNFLTFDDDLKKLTSSVVRDLELVRSSDWLSMMSSFLELVLEPSTSALVSWIWLNADVVDHSILKVSISVELFAAWLFATSVSVQPRLSLFSSASMFMSGFENETFTSDSFSLLPSSDSRWKSHDLVLVISSTTSAYAWPFEMSSV